VSKEASQTYRMPGLEEECERLATLESFDPDAFRGSGKVSQDVCNFVLALALIYNDCKDSIYAHVVVGDSKPEGAPRRTRAWGALNGAHFHAFRAVAGVLHELCVLIRESEGVLRDTFFVSVIRRLPAKSRRAWEALVEVAIEATPKEKLGKQLHRLRNKVTFHYDPKALFLGFEEHFLSERRQDERAFVSRGENMRATRFFFADAAATGYLRSVIGSDSADTMRDEMVDAVHSVNHGLMVIVRTFIEQRGRAWRQEAES
jgi:hypothetical protein